MDILAQVSFIWHLTWLRYLPGVPGPATLTGDMPPRLLALRKMEAQSMSVPWSLMFVSFPGNQTSGWSQRDSSCFGCKLCKKGVPLFWTKTFSLKFMTCGVVFHISPSCTLPDYCLRTQTLRIETMVLILCSVPWQPSSLERTLSFSEPWFPPPHISDPYTIPISCRVLNIKVWTMPMPGIRWAQCRH